jgi:uncharacterized membrane-anchored protein
MEPAMDEHPLRDELVGEAHARPTLTGATPCLAVHEAAMESDGSAAARAYMSRLALQGGGTPLDASAVHHTIELPGGRLKWERHGEFSAYTAISTNPAQPVAWPEGRPGLRIAAVRVEVQAATDATLVPVELHDELQAGDCAMSLVTGKKALIYSNFRVSTDGYTEFVLRNASLTDRQLGRILRRLFEIETYRTTALLAFPIARSLRPRLDRLEEMLRDAIARMGDAGQQTLDISAEEAVLATLSQAAQEAERCLTDSEFRFAAARAYGGLVMARLDELREDRVDGFQRIGTFLRRRFTPALDTVEASRARLAGISVRIERASALLRTRIDLERQRHNQGLLASMEKRARVQAKLQETVEGLSQAAITYYVFMLVSKVIDHFRDAIPIDRAWQDPLLIITIFTLVVLGTWAVKRSIQKSA